MEWTDENHTGVAIYPEDGSADMGVVILFEPDQGLPSGIYFSAVEYVSLNVIVGAVVSLFIPGYGHVESDNNYEL
jgi:hypothetical protein